MLTIIRSKSKSGLKSDVGQYNIVTKKLQLWVNSTRIVNGDPLLHIPDFDIPEDIKHLELLDEGRDARLNVPIEEFKSTKTEDGYALPFDTWLKKYRNLF